MILTNHMYQLQFQMCNNLCLFANPFWKPFQKVKVAKIKSTRKSDEKKVWEKDLSWCPFLALSARQRYSRLSSQLRHSSAGSWSGVGIRDPVMLSISKAYDDFRLIRVWRSSLSKRKLNCFSHMTLFLRFWWSPWVWTVSLRISTRS